MDDREKKINRLKLKQLVKNNPEKYKKKVKQVEHLKTRNNLLDKPKTFDVKRHSRDEQETNIVKTLDFTNNVKMPDIK